MDDAPDAEPGADVAGEPLAAGLDLSGVVESSLTGLAEAFDELVWLSETDPHTLGSTERTEAIRALASLHGQVAAILGQYLAIADVSGDHARDGARSMPAWSAARTELSSRATSALLERAKALRDCPIVTEAHLCAALGTAKVDALLDCRKDVEARFAAEEAWLVETIRPLTVRHARIALARWRELALSELDSSPDDPKPSGADDGGSLSITTGLDGQRIITGCYDPITGAEVQGLIAAEVDRRFASGEFRADDGLTPTQRNAVAHHALIRRGSLTSSERGNLRPSVTVLVDLNTLLGLKLRPGEDLLSRRCELADGTVIPLARVLELMQDATLNTVLGHFALNGRFEPVGTITTARHANAQQRRALTARDQGCVFPGCDRPPEWTDAHHVDGWRETHQTAVPRLVLLCSHHHHAVHDRGFTLTTDDTGAVTVQRPDRSLLPDRPGPGQQVPTDIAARSSERSRPQLTLARRRRNRNERDAYRTIEAIWTQLTRPLLDDLQAITEALDRQVA
ncbi:MAG: DUF222 domain-containing protein [Acidimicrobiales bacterium]|nr:DUF222 domain-containing protein [Acidimicrobiales bacterium]